MKRAILELFLGVAGYSSRKQQQPQNPESILILRNNDIGDLLAVTPLFEALKKRFPDTKICAGIGGWNFEVLKHNPWVDEIHPINAPWHNKQTARHPANSFAGWRDSIQYIYFSPESAALKRRNFTIGVDVLGSPQGSLLMLRAGIPYRLGVRGYAGGHSACHHFVDFSDREHVGRGSFRLAELLGANQLPENRPRIFLSAEEKEQAEHLWINFTDDRKRRRIVLAPGGGFREKCWPLQNFVQLVRQFNDSGDTICIVGGPSDKSLGDEIASAAPNAVDWTGKASLRETFALISASDLVICNSSMAMHAAAAFRRKTIVVLGEWYSDAEQHAIQWGYKDDFLLLGRAAGHPQIATVGEVINAIAGSGWQA